MSQKDEILRSWLENQRLKPDIKSHALCFDLRDRFSRDALLLICRHIPKGDTRYGKIRDVLSKPQNRMQSMFATEELFASIAKVWKPEFEWKPDHFGLLYFGCGGISLFWFPIPAANDGQNRKMDGICG